TTRCQSRATSSRWAHAPTAAATTTIPIRSCAAAIASCRSTSTYRAARRRLRRCSTACCCCRRRFAVPARSSGDDMSEEALRDLASYLKEKLVGRIGSAEVSLGELTIEVEPDDIIEVLTFLRDDVQCRFVSFIDLCGVDYPDRPKRFDVVYHLLSPRPNQRVRDKVQTDEDTRVPSATAVYPGADWFEREAYDLYGILFTGHPDLRRILTDYGFEGHPMRKDFPLTGYVEVRWDDELKRVVYEPVELKQEFRNFDFLSPWEGTDYVLPGDEKAKQ